MDVDVPHAHFDFLSYIAMMSTPTSTFIPFVFLHARLAHVPRPLGATLHVLPESHVIIRVLYSFFVLLPHWHVVPRGVRPSIAFPASLNPTNTLVPSVLGHTSTLHVPVAAVHDSPVAHSVNFVPVPHEHLSL